MQTTWDKIFTYLKTANMSKKQKRKFIRISFYWLRQYHGPVFR